MRRLRLIVSIFVVLVSPRAWALSSDPHVTNVAMVTPTILGLTVEAQTITRHELSPYVAATFGHPEMNRTQRGKWTRARLASRGAA